MPPKRKPNRTTQLQPQSDYDTDTANNTDNQPMAVTSPPPLRSNEELNLLVLRRWCPEIQGIIAIAPFAVLYTFSPETQQWEKSETQGTLFICQLSGAAFPRYRVIILNRKGPENFHLDLVSTENIEVTEEYVIVQIVGEDDTPLVYGIWIFSDGDSSPDTREIISQTIMDCARRAEEDAQSVEIEGQEASNGMLYENGMNETNETNEHAYATNGEHTSHYEAPTSSRQQPAGQQIDLATLFAKPQMQPQPEAPPNPPSLPPHLAHRTTNAPHNRPPLPPHLANLPANAAPESPAYQQSTQFVTPEYFRTGPPPPRDSQPQNALLDLFRNAKRG